MIFDRKIFPYFFSYVMMKKKVVKAIVNDKIKTNKY